MCLWPRDRSRVALSVGGRTGCRWWRQFIIKTSTNRLMSANGRSKITGRKWYGRRARWVVRPHGSLRNRAHAGLRRTSNGDCQWRKRNVTALTLTRVSTCVVSSRTRRQWDTARSCAIDWRPSCIGIWATAPLRGWSCLKTAEVNVNVAQLSILRVDAQRKMGLEFWRISSL